MTDLLRCAADDYEQAQRVRIAQGERIRALAQGRDEGSTGYLAGLGFKDVVDARGKVKRTASDQLLGAILEQSTDEPHPYLCRTYRRSYEAEKDAYVEMAHHLDNHPAWEWASQVKGVGPTLGGKILSRLDIDKAPNQSHFWSYAGYRTVPGQEWVCDGCGWRDVYPATHTVTGKHRCKAKYRQLGRRVNRDDARAAAPSSVRGEPLDHDKRLKKTMYVLSASFLKAGKRSFYENRYRSKRRYYERERPGWAKAKIDLASRRIVNKLFLSHLHEAWSIAIGREPRLHYAGKLLDHDDLITAADVLQWESQA